MAVIERERVQERPAPKAPAPQRRFGTMIWALAILAIAAVAAVAVILATGGEDGTQAAPDLRSEQQILADLANQGYIPAAAVDHKLLMTERMVNQGLVPAQALEPYAPPVEPLYTAQELSTLELAESGQIPMESVDWDEVALKRLVNQGLIPRQALEK